MRVSNAAVGKVWLLLGLVLLAASNHSAHASSLPAGFSDASVSRPDGLAWDGAAGVAFANDGRMFVWERAGRVWLAAGAAARSAPLIDLSDEVSTIGSLGLTGFALDPQFAQNGYLYLFYAVDPEQLANCASPATGAVACRATYRSGRHASSGATIGRLVRYQLVRPAGAQDFSTATTVNAASRRVLLGETPAAGGAPAGCVVTDTAQGPGGIAFGNDGTLFVGCGDGASASTEDSGSNPNTQYQQALAAGLMTPAENVGAFRAQLVESLSGKILRLDAATGGGLPDNPFYDATAPRAARSRVWVLGLHNPQHFSVRPGSAGTAGRPGTLYIGDVGYSTWESLAVAREGRMNFGWPLYEGIGNDTTSYAGLPAFDLEAPNPLFPSACSQRYFRFLDLISPDPLRESWPNPCQPLVEVPAGDAVFIRDRPAIDWLHGGPNARWAAFDNAGEPLALTLGTRAPNGTLVSGPLFGGTASIGGVWYQGSSFPAPFRDVYYHADSGGEWIKAFAFDGGDNPLAVNNFLASGGPIGAIGVDPRSGDLYYITGTSGSEVHRLTYSPMSLAAAGPAVSLVPLTTTAPTLATQLNSGTPAGAPSAAPVATTTRKILAASDLAQALTTANWSSGDIGAVGKAGSYSLSGSTYTVNGSGGDIWNAADAFQFVSQPLTGDGSITARVVSQTNTDPWAKSGIMFRETLAAGATNAFAAVTIGNGVIFTDRATTGGTSVITYGPHSAAPYWLRVVRAGSTFTAYASPDGNTWTQYGQYTITMASQAYVGLAVTSHNNGALGTAVFDNVTVVSAGSSSPAQAPTVPTGLAVSNLAATSLTLSWTASTNAGSSGVGGYYVYRNGSTTPLATVTSGTSFNDSGLTPATIYSYQVAAFDTSSPPNVSAASTALSVTTSTAVASGWSSGDIGAVTAAGSYSLSGGTFTVSGSGADIWNAADEFQFVSQPLTGDGSITARVVSQTNTNVWAKAGVMFRETLTTGATNAFAAVTPSSGVVYQVRPTTGAASFDVTYGPIVATPYWVRMVRAGNLFTAYYSPNGNTWTSLGQYTITMASQAYVGLAVSSHANGALSTAMFDNVTVAGQIALTLAPQVAAITQSQSQQFTATISGGGAATWTVDGVAGGNSAVGTITGAGLYTPGSAVGAHTIVATSVANPSLTGSASVAVTGLSGVYTYHNDLSRDGANSQEYALTAANVNKANFGKLFSCPVDGAIYAQPLWVANVSVNGSKHNVVYVATQHDSLYAFDADANPCVTLWKVSLIDTAHGATGGETTVPSGIPGYLVGQGFGDITPEVGVTGTPVIDPSGTFYVVSKSVNSAGTTFYQRLHAIDLTNGTEKGSSPVTIAGSVPGTGDFGSTVTFSSRQENQRPGLALVNGTVYISWSSHEDTYPWHGWMMGYTFNGSSFTQSAIFNVTPNGVYGGIWMGGGAPAADSSNNLYVLTGNGVFDANSSSTPNNDYGDSLLKLSSNLKVSEYFTPSDQLSDYDDDDDFGSGGAAILADLPAGSPLTHLVMGGGKDGTIYVLNRDLLGSFGDGNAVQPINFGYSIYATGAYWNNYYYLVGINGPLVAYLLDTTVPKFNLAASSSNTYGFPGSSPSVSAAGTANGIVWTVDNSNYCTNQSPACRPAVLHAYNATNVKSELWNSSMVSTDAAGNAVKFAVPTIANGKVYLGTRGNNSGGTYGSTTVSGELDVYGLKSN